jgi:hypothetical protein
VARSGPSQCAVADRQALGDNTERVLPDVILDEPATALTDYALAAASLVFAALIGRSIGESNRLCGWFWCATFTACSVAAVAGGTFHGFASVFGAGVRAALWNVVMFSIGAAAGLAGAAIYAGRHAGRPGATWLTYGIAITLAGLVVQQGFTPVDTVLNRNASYHLIQIAALYCLFRYARIARDWGVDPSDVTRRH